MTARDVLLDLIKCNFDGAGWYGGNLLTAVRKTDYKLAGKRVGSLKTIYQQVHHAAYWKYVVIRRITGDRSMKFRYRGANWPKEYAPASDAQWKELIAYLRELQGLLLVVVESLPASRFADKRILRLLHGIASHDVYHNAQIRHVRALLNVNVLR
jgi:hypothetical protein